MDSWGTCPVAAGCSHTQRCVLRARPRDSRCQGRRVPMAASLPAYGRSSLCPLTGLWTPELLPLFGCCESCGSEQGCADICLSALGSLGGDVWKQNCCRTPIPCLIFPGTSRPFPQEPHHSTSPPAVHQGSDFSTPSPTWVSFWFFVVTILMGMRGISGVSAGTFLTMVMNIFSDAFGHLCISSGEISIKSLACFVCFLLLSGPTSKLRPDLRPHCPSALDCPPIWYFCPGRDPTAPQTEVYELSSTSIPHTPRTVHWHNSVALPTKEISNLFLSSEGVPTN